MSFTDIKSKVQAERGFTIVELLIVVVVIAILAAITIVSYNGITARANASSAASNVETVQKIAESYNADGGKYPGNLAQFKTGYTDASVTTAASKLPTGITILNPAIGTGSTTAAVSSATHTLTASNGTSNVEVFVTGLTGTSPNQSSTGGVILSWDYSVSPQAVQAVGKYTYYGSATPTSTFVALPAS